MSWREPRRVLELARVVVAPRDGYPDAGPGFLADASAGPRGPRDVPRCTPVAAVGQRAASPCRERPVVALSRPGCGRGLHRRPWALPDHSEDLLIVTEPAMPRRPTDPATAPRADGLPQRASIAPTGRAPAARARPPDRRAGRGQEGGRHRPPRPCRPDHDGRLLRHLLGRLGAAARRPSPTGSSGACATRRRGRSDARAPPHRTGSWSTSGR